MSYCLKIIGRISLLECVNSKWAINKVRLFFFYHWLCECDGWKIIFLLAFQRMMKRGRLWQTPAWVEITLKNMSFSIQLVFIWHFMKADSVAYASRYELSSCLMCSSGGALSIWKNYSKRHQLSCLRLKLVLDLGCLGGRGGN